MARHPLIPALNKCIELSNAADEAEQAWRNVRHKSADPAVKARSEATAKDYQKAASLLVAVINAADGVASKRKLASI